MPLARCPYCVMIPRMQKIDGRAIAKTIREEVKKEVASLPSAPKLGVILVGDDPASHLYVGLKEKAAAEAGILTDIRKMPSSATDEEIIRIIMEWNDDPDVHAILVQIPLPPGHDADRIIAEIDPNKDADGFHPENVKALETGEAAILSPVHEAIVRCIGATGIDPRWRYAAIIANSDTFSRPLTHILQKAGFSTAVIHPDDLDADLLTSSDVIVIAIGRPRFLGPDIVKPGAVIIDVGTTKDAEGKVRGDADAEALQDAEGWITPVPGGIGPMTVALLLKNVVRLYKAR
jgi:methylenetetrahydrofolate dehydrogenase (NADP+)/methenyltetrahydrofolate cyclohydrolase